MFSGNNSHLQQNHDIKRKIFVNMYNFVDPTIHLVSNLRLFCDQNVITPWVKL